jgi:hypothetical protein
MQLLESPQDSYSLDDFARRNHIGLGGEIARLQARVAELESQKRLLESENLGLKSEVEELKAKIAALTAPPPPDDGLDIPECLRRPAL